MSIDLLKCVRNQEIKKTLWAFQLLIPPAAKILEVGGGAGWQAATLKKHGYQVISVDVPSSTYLEFGTGDVIIYDGDNIPFPNKSFDVVFTSHVLTEITDLEKMQIEMSRVLKTSGLEIHIVPSATWRFWTNVTHYLCLFRVLISRALRDERVFSNSVANRSKYFDDGASRTRILSITQAILRNILPSGLGRRGNALSQLYSFSRSGWESKFNSLDWMVEKRVTSQLFYTGHSFLDTFLSIRTRRILSRFLGSASHIFLLKRSFSNDRKFLLLTNNTKQPRN